MKAIHYLSAIIWVILTSSAVQEGAACDHGWLSYGSRCYKIFTPTFTYAVADISCKLEGSSLASITSMDIMEFLTPHLISQAGSNFWVGLTSRNRNVQWVDGTSTKDQPWVKPFPVSGPVMRFCFAFNAGGFVQHQPCYSRLPFVCEHLKSPFSSKDNCLPHITEHSFIGEETGNCVFKVPGSIPISGADEKCNDYGAHFLDIDQIIRDGLTSFYERKVLTNDGSKYWTKMTWNGTDVLWSTGKALDSEFPIPFVQGSGNCITVMFNFTSILETHLFQTECNDTAYVVCALNPVPSWTTPPAAALSMTPLRCPPGHNWKSDLSDTYCYWETSYETNRMSWDDARKYCQGFEGDLGSFHNIDEEKIGLSFQYGTLAHPYWIGLRLDPDTETYKWSDGSPLDYENWAPGHPDHKDKRLQCVAMDAANKHWFSSLCGILSWFICKVPKKSNPSAPVIPTRAPMIKCDDGVNSRLFYYQGYCYSVQIMQYSWHRARQYCENEGSTLVSIHDDEEIGFLLRLLYDEKPLSGNRVWIGLNSLSPSGAFQWTDWSPLDFTFWNDGEPNNDRNQEKCCNMYIGNGLWNDENCNAAMGFICKRMNDTSVTVEIPTTPDPTIGNCKKGWYEHHDRCYLTVGIEPKNRANWTEASRICQENGGYLTSVRNTNDQVFLAYLMQSLGEDTWIGLHYTIQTGRYYWLDNSDFQYSNWAPGEPSFFGLQEDCVKMTYKNLDSGVWKDDLCWKELAFICHMRKDPQLPEPTYNRGLGCIYPEGWLKLDNMCFKMFAGNPMTWQEAESACQREGAHLVSVSGMSVQAVVGYLATEVNQTFWIGLQYKESTQQISWLNNWPVTLSKWNYKEPGNLKEDSCFASTASGFWITMKCSEEMPYICQITAGKTPLPKQYGGECPKTSDPWVPSDGSYCYIFNEKQRIDWYMATVQCFKYGSYLTSLHSLNDLDSVKKLVKSNAQRIYIGLRRNQRGGFEWTDKTPVDFINWDEGQPENADDNCVEMIMESLKWRVVPCTIKKQFVCAHRKDRELEVSPENAKLSDDSPISISAAAIAGIFFALVLIIAAVVVAAYYYRPLGKSRFRILMREQSMSFENALYNADASSLEFQEKRRNSMTL